MKTTRVTAMTSFGITGLALMIGAAPAASQTTSGQRAPAAATATAPSATGSLLSSIPGVTIKYYDVTGTSPTQIRQSMQAGRPTDPKSGKPTDALSRWSMGVGWQKSTTSGKCAIVNPQVNFKAEVTLPRLVAQEAVPSSILERWKVFIAAMEERQAARLRGPLEGVKTVQAAIQRSNCEGARAAAAAAIAEIEKKDLAANQRATPITF